MFYFYAICIVHYISSFLRDWQGLGACPLRAEALETHESMDAGDGGRMSQNRGAISNGNKVIPVKTGIQQPTKHSSSTSYR
jgi:hypothetical protein